MDTEDRDRTAALRDLITEARFWLAAIEAWAADIRVVLAALEDTMTQAQEGERRERARP